VHPWLAVFIAVAFMCRPVMILYENWLFYEYPVALMLCLSAVFLHRFIEVESSGDALIFFSILACLALTRCIFNAAYLVAAAALIIFFKKGLLKKVLRTAVIPLVIVLLFNAKDYCLFGKMSFGEVDLKQSVLFFLKKGMTQYQITLLQKDGKLSPIFQIPEFSQVSSYLPYVHVENTGIPALDIADKGNGFPNFNNIIYLKVPHLYFHDALTITKKYPFDAIKMVLQHHENYFSPASFIWPYTAGPREYLGHTAVNNYRAVKPMAVMYDMVLLWDKGRLKGASPVLLAILPLLVIYALLLARRSLAGPQRNESLGITLLFMLIMVAVDALASILTWDPQRFRFDVDSYYVVFFALLINDLAARMRTQRDGATRRIA
jgi:hypothetical protein